MSIDTTGVATTQTVQSPRRDWADIRRLGQLLRAVLRRPMALTGLAGVAGVLLTVTVLPPPMYADSYWIWHAAELWPNIPADFPILHQAMRLGTVLPTRVAQEVLGPGHVAWIAASALFMALFTAGIFATGRTLFNNLIGFASVGLVIVNPFFTVVDGFTAATTASTGSLLPDVPAAGLFSLGVAALVVASRRSDRRQVWWLAGGGVCLGLAYLTREYVAFMFVAIPIFFALLRIPWRRLVVPAVPMLALLGAELAHNAIVYGDAFARLTVAGEHGSRRVAPVSIDYVVSGFFSAMERQELGGIFIAGLALTAVGAVAFRDRRLVLLLVWFLALWLPLTILGGLLDPWEPNLRVHLVRYWTAVFAPIVVGGLATIKLGIERLGSAKLDRRPILAAVAVLAAVYLALAVGEIGRVHRDEDWRQLRTWLAAHPEVKVIYTDDRTRQAAGFYAVTPGGEPLWHGSFRTFTQRPEKLPAERIGHIPYLESVMGSLERPDPAAGWQVLWRSDNAVLTIWQR